MKWWKKIAVSGMGLMLLALGESIRECRSFRMTHYDLKASDDSGNDQKSRIIFLSDLHNQVYGNKNDVLLEAIRREKPDLILIGGDMLIGKKDIPPDPALELIRQLPQIAPVYYALGNHEQRLERDVKKYGDVMYFYKKELVKAGVHFLENASADITLPHSHKEVRITGLALSSFSYEMVKYACVSGRDVERLAGPADRTRYQILLAHNPVYVSAYKAWGADLVLCGHLHGGVVRIPGWRGVVTPHVSLFPKYSGEMKMEDKTAVVVSKGLGTHTVNLRLFNPAEVIVLHL